MKTFNSCLAVAAVLALTCTIPAPAQQAMPAGGAPAARANSSGGASPHETTGAVIGDRRTGNRVTVTYGRPYAKGRTIWGGQLAPNGAPYRLGADEATLLITQQPIAFGETVVPAGAYTLYMVPMESGASKLAISKSIGGWGVPVNTTNDLARVDLTSAATVSPVEQLTIRVANDTASGGGTITISWGDKQFSAAFIVKR